MYIYIYIHIARHNCDIKIIITGTHHTHHYQMLFSILLPVKDSYVNVLCFVRH